MLEDVTSISEAMKTQIEVLEHELASFKTSAGSHSPLVESLPSKIKVLDPKPFYEARNAKELENFLWDMEQYFNVGHYPEHEMVMVTSMYLSGDAKLWCCTRLQDNENARIEMWEQLKKEL